MSAHQLIKTVIIISSLQTDMPQLPSNVGNGIGIGIGGGIGVDEDERAIVGLVAIVVVEVGGAEIDAGATFKGSEESGGHVGADPIGRPV
uniref:Uncharacterized protein n=1 Tax=Fagus sylvatica TaxID=28930 RepID=A0A2N9ILI7_FAGSY